MKERVKKNTEVVVIAGAWKGSAGKVLSVDRQKDHVVVAGVNVRRVTLRSPDPQMRGVHERECPIHISNVMLKARYESRYGEHDDEEGEE